jgi:hypothetical protein
MLRSYTQEPVAEICLVPIVELPSKDRALASRYQNRSIARPDPRQDISYLAGVLED